MTAPAIVPDKFTFTTFSNKRSVKGNERTATWAEMVAKFSVPKISEDREDVSLFTPGKLNGPRKLENVESIGLFVVDMDGGYDPSDFIQNWQSKGLAFFVYTTYRHRPDFPKWRAVFPLSRVVSKEDWPAFWSVASDELAQGLLDGACKDASRMYFAPCCKSVDQAVFAFDSFDGHSIDVDDYLSRHEEKEHVRTQEQTARGTNRVGDLMEEQMTIAQILEPCGWVRVKSDKSLEYWRRPGKDTDHSATWGYREKYGGNRLMNFSSSSGLPTGILTMFSVYAHLNWGGDFKLAAKEASKILDIPLKHTQLKVVDNAGETNTGVVVGDDFDRAREFTDAANGERLVALFGDDFRYVSELKSWAHWNGHRWEISQTIEGRIRQYAKESAMELQRKAGVCPEPDRAKKMLNWAVQSQNSGKLDNAMKEAQSLCMISVLEFDTHPWLLNCPNGIVNLRTGELMKHDKSLLLSQVTGCDFATEKREDLLFQRFIERIMPDPDTRQFLLRFVGYSLTGVTDETAYCFLHGNTGNNGKSTLVNIIQYILNDYSVTLDTDAIMQSKGVSKDPEYEIARLRGKRFAAVNEVSDSQKLNEPLIKRLTGGDKVRARQIFGHPFEFPNTAKIWMTGNNKPAIYGQDSATWKRVNLIPFEVTIPKEEADPNLVHKMKDEASYILRALVGFCVGWVTYGFTPSELMLSGKVEYKEENDFMGVFVNEELTFYSGHRTGCTDMHQHYLEWAKKNGCPTMTPTAFGRIFGQKMQERQDVKRVKTRIRNVWEGVAIRGQEGE